CVVRVATTRPTRVATGGLRTWDCCYRAPLPGSLGFSPRALHHRCCVQSLEVAVERVSPKAKGWELVSVIDIDGDAAEVCDVLDGASVALSLVKLSGIPSGIRYEMWADPTLRAEELTSLVE